MATETLGNKKNNRYIWEKDNIETDDWNPRKGSRCLYCKHLISTAELTCKAFPKGIPHEILSSEFNHINKHPKDHGIQFKLDKKKVERWGL